MPQQAGSTNPSLADAPKWKRYAGGVADLVADSPDGRTCARLVIMLAAGDLTSAFGPAGEAGGNMAASWPARGLPSPGKH